MRLTYLLSVILVLCVSCSSKQVDDQPNILLILIDDMGWKDISCAGSTYYETPNIDKLASEGMRFLNAYSAGIVCTPSRGAIYSGKCPARTKLTTPFIGPAGPDDRLYDRSKYQGENDQYFEALHRHALPIDEVILAQSLAEGGYITGFFGKWHVGECEGYYPDDRGFQVAKGYRLTAAPTARSGHWMKTFQNYGANLEGVDKDAYVADVLTNECIEFIEENSEKTWLAVLSHYLVHNPIQPKDEKLKYYEDKPSTDQNNPGYAAMVESVDESVGRVIQKLEELGIEENTMVIFTSDNGGLTPNNTSNYPLMGGKSFPFEAGMKVPFILKWPEEIKPGISEERIVGMDIYPTMLAAAGLPLLPEQHVDGLSILPHLVKNSRFENRPIVFHNPHYTHATGPFSSIIVNNWKLIKFYNDEFGANLLYNLSSDAEEQNNLAFKNEHMRSRLSSMLDSILLEMDAELPIINPNYNPNYNPNEDIQRFHLNFTKDLAEKERLIFESRILK